uniref:PCAF N-terminal domain-containing protein n=1 Tax=Timema douglasi TaxID=61478 RepID=A0A7R8V9A7_TIMDO|nr:unnamed protein product [Timema douglasi]
MSVQVNEISSVATTSTSQVSEDGARPSTSTSSDQSSRQSNLQRIQQRKQQVYNWPHDKKLLKLAIYSACQAAECKCNGWKAPVPPAKSQPLATFVDPCRSCTHTLEVSRRLATQPGCATRLKALLNCLMLPKSNIVLTHSLPNVTLPPIATHVAEIAFCSTTTHVAGTSICSTTTHVAETSFCSTTTHVAGTSFCSTATHVAGTAFCSTATHVAGTFFCSTTTHVAGTISLPPTLTHVAGTSTLPPHLKTSSCSPQLTLLGHSHRHFSCPYPHVSEHNDARDNKVLLVS